MLANAKIGITEAAKKIGSSMMNFSTSFQKKLPFIGMFAISGAAFYAFALALEHVSFTSGSAAFTGFAVTLIALIGAAMWEKKH